MISTDRLSAVRVIVSHANCADGYISAIVCARALPGAKVVLLHHGSAEQLNLVAETGMLFVDCTPPRDRIAEFIAAGAMVIDHHLEQADIVAAFGEYGVYSDEPGVSGAVLAFRDLGPLLLLSEDSLHAAERVTRLAGIYDTWQTEDPERERSCRWREAQLFAGYDHLNQLSFRGIVNLCEEMGGIMYDKAMAAAHEAARNAEHVEINGVSFAIIPTRSTNYVADLLAGRCDVVAGFSYEHDAGAPRLVWSLRGVDGYLVLPFVRRHRGGGHPHAAGFSVPDDGRSPYARARDLFAYPVAG